MLGKSLLGTYCQAIPFLWFCSLFNVSHAAVPQVTSILVTVVVVGYHSNMPVIFVLKPMMHTHAENASYIKWSVTDVSYGLTQRPLSIYIVPQPGDDFCIFNEHLGSAGICSGVLCLWNVFKHLCDFIQCIWEGHYSWWWQCRGLGKRLLQG